MIPMQTHINELKKEIDSLEWEGNFYRADQLKYELFFAEQKLQRGELYEPNF
jgi:hypothetical protein